jgi:thioredoxin-like negative regulator of GroEL
MKKLLYFGASWCGPCKRLKPIVEKEAPEQGYDVEFLDIEDDDDTVIAESYNVRSVPTIIVIENGKETKRAVGNTAWEEVK